jgi:putative ABC transport system ATP-binding protein
VQRALTRLRRVRVGFVFQSFNLLPVLTAEQNVMLPLRLAGGRPHGSRRVHRERAREALGRVGLGDRARSRPSELSGGQQQRVALARALVTEPEVICADEPTGALDPVTAEEVLALLRQSVDGLGATVLMVTHDPVAAACADRVLFLADGLVADELLVKDDPVGR